MDEVLLSTQIAGLKALGLKFEGQDGLMMMIGGEDTHADIDAELIYTMKSYAIRNIERSMIQVILTIAAEGDMRKYNSDIQY